MVLSLPWGTGQAWVGGGRLDLLDWDLGIHGLMPYICHVDQGSKFWPVLVGGDSLVKHDLSPVTYWRRRVC